MSPPPALPPDMVPEARALMADMAGGDKRALGRLITLYGRGLTLYCARALDRTHDAEDAVQEVFLKAWTSAAREAAVLAAEAVPFDRAKAQTALTDLRTAVDALMQQAQIIALDSLAAR